jgi:outer membrane protein assembly factor BamB
MTTMTLRALRSTDWAGWLVAVALPCLLPGTIAADWPQFRGLGGFATAPDARNLPAEWSAKQNLLWQTKLPGPGSSSPIVVGDRIFVTCYSGYGLDIHKPGKLDDLTRHVLCLDRNGKILWQRDVPAAQPERPMLLMHALHGYASSTPVADAERVYAFFGKSGVVAFDHAGTKLWQASVGPNTNPWGTAASPILVGDTVVVNASMESGNLVALRKTDGKEVWKSPGMDMTWSTPFLMKMPRGKEQLLVSVKYKLRAFDPTTGEQTWACDAMPEYVATCLTAHDGVAYVIGTKERVAMAIRGDGDHEVLWKIPRGSNVSSPVFHDGYLYWANENYGTAYCVRAKDGQLMYSEKMVPEGEDQRIYASPVLADGKLYYVTRKQGTFVLPAVPEYKLLAQNTIAGDDSIFNATPAISDGQILLRSNQYLYCIGVPPTAKK